MNGRRAALFVGVLALGAGLVATRYPPGGVDRWVLSGVGVLALVQAWRVAGRRWQSDLDAAETPDPECAVATPPPGDDLRAVLAEFLDTRQIHHHRERIRESLRSAATDALVQYGAATESAAAEAVATGTWTEDAHAAAVLGDERAPEPPRRARLEAALRGESTFDRGVRHAVDELAAVAGVRVDDDTPADPPDDLPAVTATESDATGTDGLVREAHPTGHWRGVSTVALVAVGVGTLAGRPSAALAGVVGVGFAAYARSAALPDGTGGVTAERSVANDRPAPGDEVEVTLTVVNESDRFLPDCRFVDGVPAALSVTEGSPRLGTALRAEETATVTYTVEARRGVHEFGPTTLIARDLTGGVEAERRVAAATTLTCVPTLEPLVAPVPLRGRATRYVGRVETDESGDGVEFAATREYRHGDSVRRIDWNRRARTGELATVEYREERAATVVLVVDARPPSYVAPTPDGPHAVDRAVDAAGRLFATLADRGDRVGITALSAESCWLPPGSGDDHRTEARRLLATHPALTPVPSDGPSALIRWRRRLRKRLAAGSQVLFLTPLVDDYAARFARLLEAYGHPVTVVSPDPTVTRTTGQRLARVARALRVSRLRAAGVPVVDWAWADPVDVALARHAERRSR